MYEVDDKDLVMPLEGVPQSSVGAPNPCVLADERTVVLAYYAEDRSAPWTGIPRMVGPVDSDESIVIVRFERTTHMFGPPNDEAFAGHPLAKRGLGPYGAFRIENSSWIRRLERMNSVHRQHRAENYWKLQHLVFSFHDSTFECVCLKFDIRTSRGSIRDVIAEMAKLLD